MIRGTLVMAVMAGDYGKIRPVLTVQSAALDQFDSIIVCPLTTNIATEGPLRVRIDADEHNGLHRPSVIMIEKLGAIHKSRIRARIGAVTEEQMSLIDERLALALGLNS